MNSEELGTKIKSFISRGAEVSKSAFEKAGDKVQEFSDKSLIRIEKKQLESKRDSKYVALGAKLSAYLETNKIELPEALNFEVESLQQEIASLTNQIKEKETLLSEKTEKTEATE